MENSVRNNPPYPAKCCLLSLDAIVLGAHSPGLPRLRVMWQAQTDLLCIFHCADVWCLALEQRGVRKC